MTTVKMNPFVKWAGGKKQLLPRLMEHVPEHFDRYYEPFIGGGAFLLDLQPQIATINDVNEQLLNVYIQLQTDVEALIAMINELDAVECDKEHYMKMRERYNKKIASGELDTECAALMIWINKHCFNGLYRVNGKGLFNVPYNNKATGSSIDEDNLRMIAHFLMTSDTTILHGDFESACETVRSGDFVYFDSPYVPVSETANFTDYTKDGFSYEDHKRLASLFRELDKRGAMIMLSNHNVPLVHELYEGFQIEEISVRRAINSDASKRVGKEVIITNY
jgi:DNA adenine methylase